MILYVIFQNYDIDYQPLGGTPPWMFGIFLSKEGAEKEVERLKRDRPEIDTWIIEKVAQP